MGLVTKRQTSSGLQEKLSQGIMASPFFSDVHS
jgi:hypothetical protein